MKSLLISLTFAMLFTCTPKKKNDKPSNNNKQDEQIPFPHPEDFKDINQHGFWALKSSNEDCKSCHGQDLKGLESANSCYECHDNYPHEWASSKNHKKVSKEQFTEECYTCHSNELNLTASSNLKEKLPPLCTSCHSYPHPEDWKAPGKMESHGAVALRKGNQDCQKCHGSDYTGIVETGVVGCVSCHSQYPHPSNFKENHNIAKEQIKEACSICHTSKIDKTALVDIKEKLPKPCTDCHAYPHSDNWTTPGDVKSHGPVAIEKGVQECQICHNDNETTSCNSCHSEYPHPIGFKEKHHDNSYNLTSSMISDKCTKCHLTRALTNTDPTPQYGSKTCHHCHNFPHDSEWMDELSENSHGKSVKNGDSTECQTCHGADLQGNGNSQKSCYNCHANYPHTSEWKTSKLHGTHYLSDLSLGKKKCHECHGEKLTGSETTQNCQSCHEYFPHTWANEREHGEIYIKNLDTTSTFKCQTCHGDDLLGGNSKVSCNSCHEVYPHPQYKYTNWRIPNNRHATIHGTYNKPSEPCSNCHYEGMKTWKPLPQCYDCHRSLGAINSLPPESNFP